MRDLFFVYSILPRSGNPYNIIIINTLAAVSQRKCVSLSAEITLFAPVLLPARLCSHALVSLGMLTLAAIVPRLVYCHSMYLHQLPLHLEPVLALQWALYS